MAQSRPRTSNKWRATSLTVIFLLFLVIILLSTELLGSRDLKVRKSALSRLLGGESPSDVYAHLFESSPHRNDTSGQVNSTSAEAPVSKAIIASVTQNDAKAADWIMELLPEWNPVIYVVDAGADTAVDDVSVKGEKTGLAENKGREASVYLSYIINHYYNLPDFMIFIHGKRYQTHNDDPMYDTFPLIANLSLEYVTEEGYTALRCNWKSCPASSVEPILGFEDGFWDTRGLYADAWQEFFPNETIPEKVAGPCCAQFAVTRETVQRWPVAKYEQIRQYMWRTDSGELSMKMGIVLEYMWHIIFGKPAWFCQPAKACYCRKWNICDLDCPTPGWCFGRVWLRDSPARFPEGWPDRGQDGVDWPYWGWWEDPEIAKQH